MGRLRWNRWYGLLGVVTLTSLSNGIILWGAPRLLFFAAGLVLICLLPGYLLTKIALPGDVLDWAEQAILTIGMGFVALILGTLGLQYLPGPLTAPLILGLYDGLILLLVIVFIRRQETGAATRRPPAFKQIVLPMALLLVAAFFRLTDLGYSEFQGDEARAMEMAAGMIQGQDEILFLHKKGPVEILLPGAFYALYGTTDELTARLPFALAGLAGVLSVYCLTRRMFPRHPLAAPVAAGLLAVDGYLVAFARIVQYQSVVFLMMVLAAWCMYRWYRDPGPAPVFTVLAALFAAIGILAHYEAVFVIPLMVWLFCARGWCEGWPWRRWAWQALTPGLVFIGVAGVFYLPFVWHPHFAQTTQYVTERRVGDAWLYNNLEGFFSQASFYNSTYYMVALILGLATLGIYQLWASLRAHPAGIVVQVALIVGVLGSIVFPQALVIQGLNLAFLPFAVILAALIVSPRVTTELKATFLWFGVPFLVAVFLTVKPKTHVYTMFPAWTILAGVATSYLIAALDSYLGRFRHLMCIRRMAVPLGGIALWMLFGYYIYIVFVQHIPNYLDGYPATQPPFYPALYGDQRPTGGLFGFPHRGGWKAIGALYAQGVLQGSYSANEESLVTSWYVRRAVWCKDAADNYFITAFVHDLVDIPVDRIRAENHLLGRVWADGRPILEMYSPHAVAAPRDYDLAALERVFDAATQPDLSLWALGESIPQHRTDVCLDERVRLIGFDAPRHILAGGALPLVLYWEPLVSFDRHYNVFVHIEVVGQHIWGQDDSTPACGYRPTTAWQPGRLVVDGHSVAVDPATPPGEYPLLVGLYDPMTGERLPVVGRDTNPYGDAVHLGTVTVVAPAAVESAQAVEP